MLANDTDVDSSDTLSIISAQPSAGGTATIIPTGINYTPAAQFVGIETISYTISDGTTQASATLTVTVEEPVPNTPPTAVADTATTTTGSTINVSVLANDSDTEGDTLTLASAVTGGSGTVSVVGNNVRYVSAANFTGNEVITYTINDGTSDSTGTLTITVNAAPTPTPTPTPSAGGSSGGSISFFALLSLLVIATRRGHRLQQG